MKLFHVDDPVIRTCFCVELEIEDLRRHALAKIPLLPFSLVVEKWRWNVFAGRIKPDEYNEAWWKLKAIYQGNSVHFDLIFLFDS